MTGNSAHIVDVPFWDYMVRIVQTVVALALLFLSAYDVAFESWNAICLALFSACWGVSLLTYYNISVHALPFIYNWIAIIITEALSVVFYAASFASCAALYASGPNLVYTNIVISIIALSAFLFVSHVLTFFIVLIGVRKHRKAGHPLFSPQTKRAQERADARAAAQANVSQV